MINKKKLLDTQNWKMLEENITKLMQYVAKAQEDGTVDNEGNTWLYECFLDHFLYTIDFKEKLFRRIEISQEVLKQLGVKITKGYCPSCFQQAYPRDMSTV